MIREKYCNDKNKEFAMQMGESPAAVNNWVRKDYSIGKETIKKIIDKFPEINSTWLLTGEGDMVKGNNINNVKGNKNISVAGNGNVSEMIEVVKESQAQMGRLIAIIEDLHKKI